MLCLTITPLSPDLLLAFLLGAALVIIGMGLFSHGAEISMSPIGEKIGSSITKSRSLPLILGVSFVLGCAVTISEPDLQVLAKTVPHIDTRVLILAVSVGVGFFLAVSLLRIVTGVRIKWLLLGFYLIVFVLAFVSDRDYLSIAFDSGGVTTGPMTVPFILALGVGVANIRSDSRSQEDSFGLVALCSIGPILSVLILGFFYSGSSGSAETVRSAWASTVALGGSYLRAVPVYLGEMALSLAPIAVVFLLFQFFVFRMQSRPFWKIIMGILFTYFGLVLFLTGVNVGFSPLGTQLGASLAEGWTKYILLPLAVLLGWFLISAEPAVHVLEGQIESVSAGAIPAGAIGKSLSVAVAGAMGLSMLRVLTGISILWFLVPGYAFALGLSFFVPDIYTSIAFDAGGVASGPMTATFMLQFAFGASSALGGEPLQDAFGLVALVAMMPLLTVQLLGVLYGRHQTETETGFDDFSVIELWGDAQ